ncbi:cell division protein FtsZ [Flavobacteriales bacterium]|jgi:cell division protein FtsZ|nr:cell division protein FtsZ [Flavobacteriales bacterium]MDG1348162.1 cell division protein FtsZ [Flavobacteriales bacterium]
MSAIDLGMDFQMPKNQSSQIKVMGIGGGGSNAVNYMYEHGIKGVDFVICNTDAQALEASPVPIKIQLGANLTEGLGAGSNPDVGKRAAEESADRITELLDANTKMLFLTAGMGGGTGTGAAPVIAEIAREKGILTVGVVTNPFSTEGGYRKQYAEDGLAELKKYVDTLLIINNDKLIEVYGDLTFTQAFGKANEVLNTATKGIAEVISQHLLVNIDLNDARKVLENSGTAVMGQSEATGENRAIEAVMGALDSPLLNDNDITGAQQVLLKIVTGTGDDEIKMSELFKIKNKIQEAAGRNVNIIEGIGIDPDLGAAVSVTVVATGFEEKRKPKEPTIVDLNDRDSKRDYKEEVKDEKTNIALDVDPVVSTLSLDSPQQALDLDEEEYVAPVDNSMTFGMPEAVETIPQITEEKKIVFELNIDEEESPEEVITAIMEDAPQVEMKTVVLEMDEENIVEEETLQTMESAPVSTDTMKVEARERETRLRAISQQLRTPSGLTNLEDVPAYKRNNVELEETTHSAENEISTYTLSDGKNNTTELKQNNSFLHDNVD